MTWRDNLRPASFRGAQFHIEEGGKIGGRRTVLHEYPKRDTPYCEDMGRAALRFSVQAYVIGPFYTEDRDALIEAMETDGPGLLIHPTMGEMMVNPSTYQAHESRLRGGMCEFELLFIESGSPGGTISAAATESIVRSKSATVGSAAAASVDSELISA